MALKKKVVAWYDELGVKYDKVTAAGNIVCKKLSKKNLTTLKAAGYTVKRIPNGSYVICHK